MSENMVFGFRLERLLMLLTYLCTAHSAAVPPSSFLFSLLSLFVSHCSLLPSPFYFEWLCSLPARLHTLPPLLSSSKVDFELSFAKRQE